MGFVFYVVREEKIVLLHTDREQMQGGRMERRIVIERGNGEGIMEGEWQRGLKNPSYDGIHCGRM